MCLSVDGVESRILVNTDVNQVCVVIPLNLQTSLLLVKQKQANPVLDTFEITMKDTDYRMK